MSFESDGIPLSWDEIKAASHRLDRRANAKPGEKRVVREYLAHEESEDSRAKEQLALPGYN